MRLNELKFPKEARKLLEQKASLKSIEFITTKSGLETIRKSGILVHSSYDPVKEAENLISSLQLDEESKYLFILLGVGLGYHLKELRKKFTNSVILPIELDADVAFAFLKKNDEFIVTRYNLNDIYTILNFTDFTDIKDVRFIQLPSLYRLYKQDYDNIANDVAKVVKSKFTDLLTRINFDKLWVKNTLLNLPNVLKYGSVTKEVVEKNFENFLGRPFVVLGAGYSAFFLLEEIKRYREKIVLCAVDTVLKTLLAYGIQPDFVFSLDSQFANLKDLFGISTRGLTLLSDIVVSPELIRNFKGDVFLTKSSHIETVGGIVYEITNNIVLWTEELTGYKLLGLESGGSVSTNLFHFALLMGGNPVFLIGVDLGFPYLVSHIKGSPSFEHFILKGNIFQTSDTFSVSSVLKDHIILDGIKEKECISHKIMETYKLWFDSASDTSNLKSVINISDGVRLKGITNLPTSEGKNLLSSLLKECPDIPRKHKIEHVKPSADVRKILERLDALVTATQEALNSFSKKSLDLLIENYPFVLNVVSKSLFPFFRGQKEFEECRNGVVKDLVYLVKIVKSVSSLLEYSK
ncbi:MAG: 6-hydroxymethylpterin diphosphokinase MptE-like protein [Brevinematia bacterium]